MARLIAAVALLASALAVSAQSSSSSLASSSATASTASASISATGTAAVSSATSTARAQPQNVTVLGEVGAQANGTELPSDATMLGVWSTDTSRGTLTQGLTLLQNSSGTAANTSVLGVFLRYNETTALRNANASVTTAIPWIAFISCDAATQSGSLPAETANSTLAAFGNATTAVPINGTATGAANETAAAATNYTAGLFAQVQAQGAKGVLLYSLQQQSCSLNMTALNMTNTSLPIFTTSSQSIAQIVVNQFQNIAAEHRYFNASLLNAATGNLSSIVSANANSNLSTINLTSASYYLLARLAPYYNTNDSSNGVVATIGRAPTASATGSVAPAPTGGTGGGSHGTSGAAGRTRVAFAATGFVVGGLLAGAGLLL